jgi:ATP-dependent helicase Lhr and Lhr-like helicase
MSAFGRLDPLLQDKIVSNLGWTSLRPVQELATDAILDGANCVVLAPTAGGKTEAAFFPVISGILSDQQEGLRALYISPTRALINNQEERLSRYTEMVGLGAFKWHGDVTPTQKQHFLREPAELLLTTPESLEVMLVSQRVPTARLFRKLRFVVVDEIHALAASDRGSHLLSVLERLRLYCGGTDLQRIGLSATVGNPEHILTWLQGSSANPSRLVDPPKEVSEKRIRIRLATEAGEIFAGVQTAATRRKSLLFCESRSLAEKLSGTLRRSGGPVFADTVFAHHSSLSREERESAEEEFARGHEACIVCTSTMELGIDVGDLDAVLQVNAPTTVSSFLQRLGRTGRREGSVANTTFFIEKPEAFLQAIAIVELARDGWVEPVRTTSRAWHILLHQTMALCLERGAISRDMPFEILRSARCFADITTEEVADFLDFLVERDLLHDDGGSYTMGLAAEKAFGRKNFMELYSVFSSPEEFTAIGLSGEVIGTVEWDFLERLLEKDAIFYLSGKPWHVERIEWKKKVVHVARATGGTVPKWGGISPTFLGYELCRTERAILVSDMEIPYLQPDGIAYLDALRDDRGVFLAQAFAPAESDEQGITWWTYAGGRVNNTLRYAFRVELGERAEVQATNEKVRIVSDIVPESEFWNIVDRMSAATYWEQPQLLEQIMTMLPDYRLSKFQQHLPRPFARELVAATVLDIPATMRFLREEDGAPNRPGNPPSSRP